MSIVTRKRASKVLSAAAIATAALAGMQSARGSLVVSLKFSDGTTTAAVSGATDLTVQVWATVTGTTALGGTTFDGLNKFFASIESSYTGGNGASILTSGSGFNHAPVYNATFNQVAQSAGTTSDLNSDGITDLGSTANTPNTPAMFEALPTAGSSTAVWNDDSGATKVVGTSSVSFLTGTINFHVAGVQSGNPVSLNVLLPHGSILGAGWWEDSVAKSTSGSKTGTNTGFQAGNGLTITAAGGSNPIISLTSSASPTGFGNQVTHVATPTAGDKAVFDAGSASNSTLTVVRASAGQYSEATALHVNNSAGAGADFVKVSGFTGGEQEIFALGVAVGSQLTTVGDPSVGGSDAAKAKVLVDAINAQSATDGGIVALNLLDSSTNASLRNFFGSQFAVALEETPGTAAGSLGWNVANGTGLSSYTVTDVAAIPEPATAGLAAIGSGILLLRRRRSAR